MQQTVSAAAVQLSLDQDTRAKQLRLHLGLTLSRSRKQENKQASWLSDNGCGQLHARSTGAMTSRGCKPAASMRTGHSIRFMLLHGPSQLTCNLIRQKKRAESSTQGFWDRKLSISWRSELNLDPSRSRSAAFLSRGTRESRTCISAVCMRHKTDVAPSTSNKTADDGCSKRATFVLH